MTDLLSEYRHVVEALRDALLDRHELVGDEILEVIRSAGPTLASPVGHPPPLAGGPQPSDSGRLVRRRLKPTANGPRPYWPTPPLTLQGGVNRARHSCCTGP